MESRNLLQIPAWAWYKPQALPAKATGKEVLEMKVGDHRLPPQALLGLGQGCRPLWRKGGSQGAHQVIKSCPCQASGGHEGIPQDQSSCALSLGAALSLLAGGKHSSLV